MMFNLRISGKNTGSIVDGPGLRYTLFVQGCPFNCPGCHNPQTHSKKGGKSESWRKIWKEIEGRELLSGVTFSGGEPFLQAKKLIPLAKKIKSRGLELASYTGFVFENLILDKNRLKLLKYIDVLIDGPFMQEKKSLDAKFKGSTNQRTIDVKKSLQAGQVVLSNDPRWV